jgi:spore coat protein U-like protein
LVLLKESFTMRKVLLAASLAALFATTADAATATASFNVTATVLSTCTASASALAFPNYTPGGGPQIANSTISVKCTKGTTFTVSLAAGANPTDSYAQRVMVSGANTLQYNLYTTAAFAAVFGDGAGGTSATMPGTGLGTATAVPITVFGQVLDSTANQAAAAGSYSDVIAVTVTY